MSTTTGHHLSERQLRDAMAVVAAGSRLNPDYKDLSEEELRRKVASVMMEGDRRGLCLAEFLPIPAQVAHDFRADLATLGRLNGWTVPEEWECPKR